MLATFVLSVEASSWSLDCARLDVHAESGEVNRYSRCLSRTTTALVLQLTTASFSEPEPWLAAGSYHTPPQPHTTPLSVQKALPQSSDSAELPSVDTLLLIVRVIIRTAAGDLDPECDEACASAYVTPAAFAGASIVYLFSLCLRSALMASLLALQALRDENSLEPLHASHRVYLLPVDFGTSCAFTALANTACAGAGCVAFLRDARSSSMMLAAQIWAVEAASQVAEPTAGGEPAAFSGRDVDSLLDALLSLISDPALSNLLSVVVRALLTRLATLPRMASERLAESLVLVPDPLAFAAANAYRHCAGEAQAEAEQQTSDAKFYGILAAVGLACFAIGWLVSNAAHKGPSRPIAPIPQLGAGGKEQEACRTSSYQHRADL
ncbi:hypothetical protein EMIHUDRAFT_195620 [Emiliania huxleyi CCMP1516]|uniref:Uncharacterized protein n=2 Tax=Emiliania huxleyi TaxID=2903 RepID=A0A0D3JHT3_EMIH1|nr:hypothetical protein EMIHUDRAFT_195620 [Emiliania huxleyi CCMP1516]EOD23068.1 hypothetical protein EMIHUDRAFT_195620 [Emiliania huxleyi CCMP1516]|eukprot:XP_005775497.1 hypothetical protein EMIHUDRAFT_195620 [Emiliania huxleyi CCMP1516]